MLHGALALVLPLVASVEPFSVAELNFEIGAPAADWEWLELETGTATRREFACQNATTGGRLTLMVVEGRFQLGGAEQVDEFQAALAKNWEDQGFALSDIRHERATLGALSADRYRYQLTGNDGALLHGFRYVAAAGRLYVLEGLSETPEEPIELETTAQSFRVLEPPARESSSGDEPALTFGVFLSFAYCFLVFVCGMVGATANTFFDRRWNGWRVGVYAILALTVAMAILLVMRLPDGLTPFRQGELFGSMVLGPAFWPVVLGGFFWWRFHRKNEPARNRRSAV